MPGDPHHALHGKAAIKGPENSGTQHPTGEDGCNDSHGNGEHCPTAPREESHTREPQGPPVSGEFRTKLFVCTASAGIDRLFRSLRNIPFLLRCSWENLVQHMQAINVISGRKKKKKKKKRKKNPSQNKPKDKTQPQLTLLALGLGSTSAAERSPIGYVEFSFLTLKLGCGGSHLVRRVLAGSGPLARTHT